jgi:pimeloyl-ACP methyl ester carboxylesterase
VKSGIVVSFSPVINAKFRAYMEEIRVLIASPEGRANIGHVVNSTVGKYLPRLVKRLNYRHIASLSDREYEQIKLYIDQVIMLDAERHVERCASIEIPLLFVNGSLDEYSTPEHARTMSAYVRGSRFAVIEGAGHFLDLEGRKVRALNRAAILGFLGVPGAAWQESLEAAE